jgi:hypothetical protein
MAHGYKFVTGAVTTILSDDVVPAYPLATLTAYFTANTSTVQNFTFDTQGFTSFSYVYSFNGERVSNYGSGTLPPQALPVTITIGAGTLSCVWTGVFPNTGWNINTITIVVLGI